MAGKLTDAEVERIRDLHGQGLSRNKIAAELGRSMSTVTAAADRLGLTFDRTRTEQATKARQIDNKARRAAIVARLYGQAEKVLARLDRPTHKMAEVSLGKVVRYEVDDLPGADIHRLVGAINVATASAVKLEQVDNTGGDEAALSMVSALAAGLQLAAAQLPPSDDGDAAGA